MRKLFVGLLALSALTASVFAAAPVGWACMANGKVYRVKVGGQPEALTGSVDAKHARWSVDGKLIFYILGNKQIWAMNNNGTEQRQIGTGNIPSGSPLAAYRPNARCVLSVEGSKFYKIHADTKVKTLIGDCGQSVYGEIGISSDGKRIAFRSSGLHMMDVDEANQKITNDFKYYDKCSGGLSPNGAYATGNCDDHKCTLVFPWRSKSSSSISSGVLGTNDNQSFAANSNDWICALGDNSVGSNKGSECGIQNRVTKEVYMVSDWSGFDVNYPDFFLGELPAIGPATQYTLTVNSGSGDGSYTAGTSVNISADAAPAGQEFDEWTGSVSGVADVNDPTTTITMPASNTTISATYRTIVTKYTLTVNSGSGDGSYAAGTSVNISADSPATGKTFDVWTGDVSGVADVNDPTTTITMPSSNATVSATYKDAPVIVATEITSPASGANLEEGTEYTLTAKGENLSWEYDAASDGKGQVSIGTGNSVSFTIPTGVSSPKVITFFCTGDNGADEVICNITSSAQTYTLTVNSGTGDGSYSAGTVVDISADAPAAGKVFDKWTGDVSGVVDATSASTKLTMPAAAVSVTATYMDIPTETFTLTVGGGTGGGAYAAGTVVDIAAGTPAAGKIFDRWTGDVSGVADVNAATTTLTMPAADVDVTATYKDEVTTVDPTKITFPVDGSQLKEGEEFTLTAEGANCTWEYDANSDGLGRVAIGTGNSVPFTIPNGITGARTITFICTGDNGTEQVTCGITSDAVAALTSVPRATTMMPSGVYLNAVNINATVVFKLDNEQNIQLSVFDISGRLVRRLASGGFGPGTHVVQWDRRDLAGRSVGKGMYFAVLNYTGQRQSWAFFVER